MTIDYRQAGSATLTKTANEYCDERGISRAMRKRANLRSLTPAQTGALFHCRRESLLVPFDEHYGVARIFDPPEGKGKFRSPAGQPLRLYEPPLPTRFKISRDRVRTDPTIGLLTIEGPFKAMSASDHGLVGGGFSSCWGWQKHRRPISDLTRYQYQGRPVIPQFDADIEDNSNVALAFFEFGDWLVAQGATVTVKALPKVAGRTTGIDDFLARKGAKAYADLPTHAWDSEYLWQLRSHICPFTEGGNADRLVYRHGDDLRRDVKSRTWLVWSGERWTEQAPDAPDVQEKMRETVAAMFDQAKHERNEQRRAGLRRWAMKSDSAHAIHNSIALASSNDSIRADLTAFDRDPLLLGVPGGGVVDLRTGKLTASVREHLITKRAGAAFDPDARCPRWLAYLNKVMAADGERIAFLQRLAGYCLTGSNPERRIFFLYGSGANGKSIFIETLLKLAGEYGAPTKTEILMLGRRDADPERPTPFLAALRGMRLVTVSEVSDGAQLNESMIKDITGDDAITSRGLKTSPVRFTPGFKVLVRGNYKPIVQGDDEAIWDRITLVPFDVRLEEAERDGTLAAALVTELSGILNWALAGCLDWQRNGLRLPDYVRDETRTYRIEMDTFALWFEEDVVVASDAHESQGALWGRYKNWCESNNTRPVSNKRFYTKLEKRGFKWVRVNGIRYWPALRLITLAEVGSRHDAAELQLKIQSHHVTKGAVSRLTQTRRKVRGK